MRGSRQWTTVVTCAAFLSGAMPQARAYAKSANIKAFDAANSYNDAYVASGERTDP